MNKSSKTILRSTVLMAFCAHTYAVSLEVSSALGVDDNPFRLSDNFSIESASYASSFMRVKLGETLGVGADLRLRDIRFDDLESAESRDMQARVNFNQRFLDKKLYLRSYIDYRDYDKTYVSRFSGETYEVNDNDASDRYDYGAWRMLLEGRYRLAKSHYVIAGTRYQARDFEDYDSLGISNLDYKQASINLGWRYQPNRQWRVELRSEFTAREYDAKVARDFNGNRIDGSILEYDYRRLEVRLRYRPSKQLTASFNTSFTDRSDNGGGYYDTDTRRSSARLSWAPNDKNSFTASLAYGDIAYERGTSATDLESEAETPSTEGWRARASYNRLLWEDDDYRVFWQSDWSWFRDSAEQDVYAYSRQKLETGLKLEL